MARKFLAAIASTVGLSLLGLGGADPEDRLPTGAHAAPKVLELRLQKVGPATYFHVRLEVPTDMKMPEPESRSRWWSEWDIARLPRLVPQDERTRAVYLCMSDDREGQPLPDLKGAPVPPGWNNRPGMPPPPPPAKLPPAADPAPPPAFEGPIKPAPAKTGAPQGAKGELKPGKEPVPAAPGEPKLPPPFPEPEAPKKTGQDVRGTDMRGPGSPSHGALERSAVGFTQPPSAPMGEPIPPPVRVQPPAERVEWVTEKYTVKKTVVELGKDGKPVSREVTEIHVRKVARVVAQQPAVVPPPPPVPGPAASPPPMSPTRTVPVKKVKYVVKTVETKLDDGTVEKRQIRVPIEYIEFVQVRNGAPLPRRGVQDASDDSPSGKLRIDTLEFVGKVQENGTAKLLLLYPTQAGDIAKGKQPLARMLQQHGSWTEVPLTLNFAKAQKVKMPPRPADKQQKELSWPDHDDLEGQWALGQAKHFALCETATDDFGFYAFARELTGKKYGVPALPPNQPLWAPEIYVNRLYEITTGAAAITESLALQRLRQSEAKAKEEQRSVDIANVQGIEVASHPWEKMLAGKKPSPEPLAKLVPHDNYYLHFKSIARFLETGDLLDQWGTTLARALQVQSRDYQLKERLEQQLCLRSSKLMRILAPAVVKSLAVTGSDPYLREGSDFTVIFHVAEKKLFLAGVEPYLLEARKAHPGKLKEDKHDYQGISVESYVTPLREVSLHRAAFDDYVVYSNSPVGLRRVIDAHRGRVGSLADALDFRYMRTVFRLEDPLEDGFLFLSDAFVRKLVGPATRIKERRRLEGLTGLYMVTHGALFTAWETGKLPNHHNQLLASTGMKPEQLVSPDGDAAFWNAEHKLAYSSAYNTLNFATPLVEIPIDKVTPSEQQEYEQFRLQYLGLWRQYFDPIGIRISLGEAGVSGAGKQVRWETFILPLVKTSQYNELRRLTGDGTIKLDPGLFSDKTVVQFLAHLSPTAPERKEFGKALNSMWRDIPGLDWLGDWFTLKLDDSPVYARLVEQMIRREIDPRLSDKNLDDDVRLLSQLPLTLGVEIRDAKAFSNVLATVKRAALEIMPDAFDWAELKEPYKGVPIVKVQIRPEAALNAALGNRRSEPVTPSLYYALVDGAWWLSFREECIQGEIDAALRRKQGPKTGAAKIDVNASLYANPKAGVHTREFLNFYLEWETHRRAVANAHLLYPLYRGSIISPADNGATIQGAALKYLGFIPVSPDFAPYSYEARTDEIVNKRHGSLRRPQLHAGIEKGRALDQILEQFGSLRADLRFREDGLHSVITFERK